MVKQNDCNCSVWKFNLHRNGTMKHEWDSGITRKDNGTTHAFNGEIPRKNRAIKHEYRGEIARNFKGTTHEFKRGIPTKSIGTIFKEPELDHEEKRDGYSRERPRKNNGTFVKQAEVYGKEMRDGYSRERPRKIINGTVVRKVEVDGKEITVTVTCESKIVDGWIEKNGGLMLGMDLEWRPSFKGGEENKAALLQLCGNKFSCLIVQLLYLDSMPCSLVGILGDPEVKIAGVGIEKDAEKLYKDYGVKCRGLVDLPYLASVVCKRTEYLFWGLKRLAKEVLGVSIGKDKGVAMSDWSRRELKPWQIEYACIDAYVSFCIAAKLMLKGWPREMNLAEFTQASF